MYKRSKEMRCCDIAGMKGGPGTVRFSHWPGELPEHVRVVSLVTLMDGDGIGYHVHEKETEIYYMIEGELVFNDNGNAVIAKSGDAMFTGSGEGHMVLNRSGKRASFLAVIVME